MLGQTMHRAMELLVAGGLSASDAWDQAVEEKDAGGDERAVRPGERRARLRFERQAPALSKLLEEIGAEEIHVEPRVTTADGLLTGRADLVAVTATGLVVVDHKSGTVRAGGHIQESHREQLLLYGAMASHAFGRAVEHLALISMAEGVVDVPFVDADIESAVAQAVTRLLAYNRIAPGSQPGDPGPENCRHCPHRARCDAFWSSVSEEWRTEIGVALRGRVLRVESSARGTTAVVMEEVTGNVERLDSCIVTELRLCREISPGETLALVGLQQSRAPVGSFKATERTVTSIG